MSLTRKMASVSGLLLLGACRSTLSLSSVAAPVPMPPAFEAACVTAAIARAPGVGRVWLVGYPSASLRYHLYWEYSFGKNRAWLTIMGKDETSTRYVNSFMLQGSPKASRLLDPFEPVMLAVDRQVEADCGLQLEGRTKIARTFSPNKGVF